MDIQEKLEILTDAAKYDVACTSSGVDRTARKGQMGSSLTCGICHSFAADGRCISLLKVLMTNVCIYDCKYCANRASNNRPRAAFTAQELADLTIGFYRRNYIEGLFLSSGVIKSPDFAMELMCNAISILRNDYGFRGYIHAKAIPGASPELIERLGYLADRLSTNIELPSEESLKKLAPEKHKRAIMAPMKQVRTQIATNKNEIALYRRTPKFVPAGQSTQMIIGASPESDYQILNLTQGLYNAYDLKRVFFSAYIPTTTDALLPQDKPVQLLREHRLYQADWLLRYYNFQAEEILSSTNPWFDPLLDPKCNWALSNLDMFPVEVSKASYDTLLRVPGIGVISARKIMQARKHTKLTFEDLKKLRVVLKRAAHFITCNGKFAPELTFNEEAIYTSLTSDAKERQKVSDFENDQLSLVNEPGFLPLVEDAQKCLTGQL